MENATQALVIAGGVLIAVMIISLGIYLFSSASVISESYDATMSENDIQQFNNKFQIYSKKYKSDGAESEKTFNLASEVVSAVNLAYSINKKNNYDKQASVDVIIDFPEINNADWKKKVYAIWPDKRIEANKIYCISGLPSSRIISTTPNESNSKDLNVFLDEFSKDNSEKFKDNLKRAYYYGFNGEVKIDSQTGLVNQVIFTVFEF